ncbi:MAG: sulfatase [Flavobacteriales bacterium]
MNLKNLNYLAFIMRTFLITSWRFVMAFGLVISVSCCSKELDNSSELLPANFATENVIVLIIDGPRFSETWGDATKSLTPHLHTNLRVKGVVNSNFYNLGNTQTISGHTAITTGVYEEMNNNGLQYPENPSFMQHWLSVTKSNPNKAFVVSSKEKLKVLANCSDLNWRNTYLPSVDAVNREDSETFARVRSVIEEHHPNLMFINVKGPDIAGHLGDWEGYKKNITYCDSLLNELVTIIDTDSIYRGKTTLIMTNDHGRHSNGIADGFRSHSDNCLGCVHINFYGYGPDFKSNVVIDKVREQIDIVPTISHIMGMKLGQDRGKVMYEIFK